MNDNVKHPAHYAEGRKYEPKDVIRDWGLNFNVGSAVKYLSRAGRKDDIIQDLKKAQEFIQFEIDAIEAERAKAVKPQNPDLPHPYSTTVTVGFRGGKIPPVTGTPHDQIIKRMVDEIFGEK